MELREILSASQLNALRGADVDAHMDTLQYVSAPARQYVLEHIAPLTKRGLNQKFWRRLNNACRDGIAVVAVINGVATIRCELSESHLRTTINRNDFVVVSEGGYSGFEYVNRCKKNAQTQSYDAQMTTGERVRLRIKHKRERNFSENAKCNRYKKIGKRGFNTTFEETKEVLRIFAYDRYIHSINTAASRILDEVY